MDIVSQARQTKAATHRTDWVNGPCKLGENIYQVYTVSMANVRDMMFGTIFGNNLTQSNMGTSVLCVMVVQLAKSYNV